MPLASVTAVVGGRDSLDSEGLCGIRAQKVLVCETMEDLGNAMQGAL